MRPLRKGIQRRGLCWLASFVLTWHKPVSFCKKESSRLMIYIGRTSSPWLVPPWAGGPECFKMENKPVSNTCPWFLHQLLPPASCPHLLQRWTVMWKCKEANLFLPKFLWSWCFSTAIETCLRQQVKKYQEVSAGVSSLSPFFLFTQPRAPTCGMVLPTFGMDLSSSVKSPWKHAPVS